MRFDELQKSYQRRAVEHICDVPYSALWLEMGLGKTASSLAGIRKMMLTGETTRALVVAGKRVTTDVWPDEHQKWDEFRDMSMTVLDGTPAERLHKLRDGADIHVINYELLPWLEDTLGARKRWPYNTAVLDESRRIKKPSGQRFRVVRRCRKNFKRVIELTGTPTAKGLLDLWAQAYILDRGERLGRTFEAFTQRWFRSVVLENRVKYEPTDFAFDEVTERMEDIAISMLAEDYLDMPPLHISYPSAPLPAKLREQYRKLEKELYLRLGEHEFEPESMAEKAMKCDQFANGALYLEDGRSFIPVHDIKLEMLRELVDEAGGAPVLVSYWFKSDLARLREAFPEGVALQDSADTVKRWNRKEIPVMFIHPESGGEGLNLQAGGNILVMLAPIWNTHAFLQLVARLWRQGQALPVFVYILMCTGTIDERKRERLEYDAAELRRFMERMRGSAQVNEIGAAHLQ